MQLLTTDLGGSRLSRAIRDRATPTAWFVDAPTNADQWKAAAETVRREFAGRPWLDALRGAISPRGAAGQRLEQVASQGGILVTTGQQPGLFGGPLLTLVKAVSARGLADTLQRELGIPAVPLFWAATDDADFDEACSTTIATDDGVVTLRSAHCPAHGTPMSAALLGDVRAQLEALRAACGSVIDASILDAVERAYAAEATIGDAYVRLLRDVLEPLEISVLDASHAAVRAAGADLMCRSVERAGEIARVVHQRIDDIRTAGFEPQVDEVRGLSLVFVSEAGIKRRLPVSEAEAGTHRLSSAALSPTVLLRPVLERALLPTVAYMAGPGELAYFAQIAPIAEALGVAAPRAVPRWSTMVLEPKISAILEQKLHCTASEIRDPARIASRLAKERMPDDVRAALGALRTQIEAGIERLGVADHGALLSERARDGLRANLMYRLDRGERRIVAALKRRDDQATRDVRVAHDALYPGGVPQERAVSWVPLLVRSGTPLLVSLVADAGRHADRLVGASHGG